MTSAMDLPGFEAALEKQGIVLVDFWASWCAPCRALDQLVEQIRTLDMAKVKADVERRHAELAGEVAEG